MERENQLREKVSRSVTQLKRSMIVIQVPVIGTYQGTPVSVYPTKTDCGWALGEYHG
jgi:hypothetical protein